MFPPDTAMPFAPFDKGVARTLNIPVERSYLSSD